MPDPTSLATGGCSCGGVRYRTSGLSRSVLQCHCENCRRLSGNYVAAVRTNSGELQIDDAGSNFAWYDLEYARYGFCRNCGSTLFFQPADRPHLTSIMVGTLDNASGLAVQAVWFADEAQPHNVLPPGVPHHAGNGGE